jgi:hypothetical protein
MAHFPYSYGIVAQVAMDAGNHFGVHNPFIKRLKWRRRYLECAPSRLHLRDAMKYLLTLTAALTLGSASFQVSEVLCWNEWGQRLLTLLGMLILAGFLCAPLWG